MCDYSLAVIPNRLAVKGEELVVHRFHTGSKGLAAAEDSRSSQLTSLSFAPRSLWQWLKSVVEGRSRVSNVTAVCVPPGARLLLKQIPEGFQRRWHTSNEEHVSFVQICADDNTYRDAIQFLQGRRVVLLQDLPEGLLVQMLSLGDEEVNELMASAVA